MPHSRFFLDAPYHAGNELVLADEEAHHLSRVMRKSVGHLVELVNGAHQLATAEILRFEKQRIHLRLLQVTEEHPFFHIILCQAIPRLNRLDIIVEKGTELGMSDLWLFPGELSEKKTLSPDILRRLRLISVAAMKQCGRLDLPKICLKTPLEDWNPLPSQVFFGELSRSAPPLPSALQKKDSVYFFVGPEAGFSANEESHLQRIGAKGVNLHPYILRTDTAPLTALSQLAWILDK